MKKLDFIDNDNLSLDQLLKYGLNKAPQGPVKVVEQLQQHLDIHFKTTIYDPNEIEKEIEIQTKEEYYISNHDEI